MSSVSFRTDLLPRRFSSKFILLENGCWEWIGNRVWNGYGRFYIGTSKKDQRRASSHRWAYEFLVGPIPVGLELDHLCRNRACCNPAHLEPVTRRQNVLRGDGPAMLGRINSTKTHCAHGHEFSETNTRQRPTGGRTCRTCERLRQPPNRGYARGSRNSNAILNERDVARVRRDVAAGRSQNGLARELGVSASTINSIISGRTWKYVPLDELEDS